MVVVAGPAAKFSLLEFLTPKEVVASAASGDVECLFALSRVLKEEWAW